MKKTIVESIKDLKREKREESSLADIEKTTQISPKRSYPFHHEDKQKQKTFFTGLSFCFPIIDLEVTPKKVELFTQNIAKQGGRVINYAGKSVQGLVDFILVNPLLQIEKVKEKIGSNIKYKEILDYHYLIDCLKEEKLIDLEKYSLFVNIEELINLQDAESAPKKRRKMESQDEADESQRTIKLSEDEGEQGQKQDMEEAILQNKMPATFSMNKFIADELTKMQKIYETERDFGRKIAYMKASAIIRGLDKQIESEKDIQNIKGIGKKIADKIQQLMTTGKMEKLQKLQSSQKTIICQQFCKIWGVGPSKANQLYESGIRSVEQLRKRQDLLTKNQKIGLKYHEEFEMKIPRQKVTRIFNYVRSVIGQLVTSLDDYRIEVCGSYRREKPTCGDIDIIISRKDGNYERHFLGQLVNRLEAKKFLTDHLTHPKIPEDRSSISYMGVCQLEDEIHHRIDIKYYPIEEYSWAILYFTGSGMFNRMLRIHAMKMGLNLSDHGVTPKADKGVTWTKPIPICYSEQDIFKFLGLDYKSPKQRDM